MLKKKCVLLVSFVFGCLCITGCGETMKSQIKLTKASYNLSSQKYDDAITMYKEYLAEKPDSVLARSRLGFAYLKSGRLNQAIEAFNTVLKTEPGEPYSVLYLGLAYLNKGEYGETIKLWQTYRNKKQPIVEKEINRLLTLVVIAESQRLAKTALREEDKLKTVKLDANTVAVCYYKDLSPSKSMRAFQKGLAEMVITDMTKIKSLKVIERLRLQALLEEMDLGKTGIVDEQSAPRVGRLVRAENLILGNLTLGINAATSVAATGDMAVKGTAVCTEKKEDFFKLPCCIVQEAVKILGVSLSTGELNEIRIPHTRNYNAFIYFGKGLDSFDAGKWKEAEDLFLKALKEDPMFLLAMIWVNACPRPNSPSISELNGMGARELASFTESAISSVIEEQQTADEERKSMDQGNGGNGGGH